MPGYSLPDAAGMWDPLGILQICRLWIIYLLKRNGHVQCRVFLRGEDILKFWQKLVWLWIVLGCEWFWGPDKWRGLGSGRRQLVVRQFCIHASTAGEAVTMITRCLAQHGDMLFSCRLALISHQPGGCEMLWSWLWLREKLPDSAKSFERDERGILTWHEASCTTTRWSFWETLWETPLAMQLCRNHQPSVLRAKSSISDLAAGGSVKGGRLESLSIRLCLKTGNPQIAWFI